MVRPTSRRVVFGFVLASLFASAASAQTAGEVATTTEDEVLRRWVERSREVASLRTQVRGARFDVVTATLWPNPTVQLNFMGTPAGTPPDGRVNVGVQWTQPLPVFGQVAGRREAAVAALSQAEVSVGVALWNIASELQSLMVARAFADARARLIERNLSELGRLEEIIRRRVAAGANSEYDALRAQATRATLRAALSNAVVERERAEARLTAVLADDDVTTVPITREGLAAFRGPEDLPALLALALRRRPDLELARRGVTASLAMASRWRRENRWTPSVWLGAYGTVEADSVSVNAGLSFPLPLFDRNQGLEGRARSDAEGQRLLSRALEVRVAREVSGAWTARDHARAALSHFRGAGLVVGESLVQRAEVTYQTGGPGSGAFTIQDLFDAYRTLWDARAQELDLQRSFAEAEADLERAVALVVP